MTVIIKCNNSIFFKQLFEIYFYEQILFEVSTTTCTRMLQIYKNIPSEPNHAHIFISFSLFP